MSKRSRAQCGPAPEGEGGKQPFSSFQPKKYRPKRPAAKTLEPLPNDLPVAPVEDASIPSQTGKDVFGAVTSLVVNAVATKTGGAKRNNSLLLSRGHRSVLHAANIPDDATYKTRIEIVSNFDLNLLTDGKGRGTSLRWNEGIQDLFNAWMESKKIWCFPKNPKLHSILDQCLFLVREGKQNNRTVSIEDRDLVETIRPLQLEWQEAVMSVMSSFFSGEIDNFMICSRDDSRNSSRSSMCASFLISIDRSGQKEQRCCMFSGATTGMIKRLQLMNAQFEIVSLHNKIDQSPELQGEVTASDLSSVLVYNLYLTGDVALRCVIDVLVEHTLIVVGDSNLLSNNVSFPQIISTSMFRHAATCETKVVSAKYLSQGGSRSEELLKPEGRVKPSVNQVVLEGYFNSDNINDLAGLLCELSLHSVVNTSRGQPEDALADGYTRNKIPNDQDREADESEFYDDICFNESFILQRKQMSRMSSKDASASSLALKEPMRLSVTNRATAYKSRSIFDYASVVASADNALSQESQSPFFQIIARSFIGVPYLSTVGQTQKSNLGLPIDTVMLQSFLFEELSWHFPKEALVDHNTSSISQIKGELERFYKKRYKISVYKQGICRLVPVVSSSVERCRKIEYSNDTERATDSNMELDPLNKYSKYAN